MPEIDKITLEVEGKAIESTKGIDSLITKLGNLDTTITNVNPQLKSLSSLFRGVASSASSLSNINFNGTVSGMEQLGRSLNILKVYTGDMKGMQTNLKGISSGVNAMKRSMSSLSEVAPNIQKMDMTGISSQIQELSKLGQLSESFMKMKEGAKSFSSSITLMNRGADRFPEMAKKVNTMDLTKFKVQVKELATVMGTFTQTINSTATSLAGFSKSVTGLPSSVSKATSAVTKAQKSAASTSDTGGVFGLGGGVNLLSNLYMITRIGKAFGSTIKLAMNFIETMNLFGVVMGENTQKANAFQEQMQTLGVDREQSMRFQSSFYDIGKSLGMTSKNAYTLSEQFTKLGYDYASLYNMPVEQSFEKLQSGIVGVVRPLRGLGKDISEAKLAETALTLGIQDNVRTMAQSDKATLRFITLMRQSGAAMNDMERTLYTPANALRILKAQFTSLARELGSLFIPMLANVLPYLIAIAKFLRGVVADIAGFFGIKLFELDFSGINTSMGIADDYSSDMADNLDSGAQSAKKIKDYMLGIDELNVLDQDTGTVGKNTGAAGVGGGAGGALGDLDLEDFGYDNLFDKIDDKAKGILETLNEWKGVLGLIAGILATIWVVGKITNFVNALKGVATTSTMVAGVKGIGGLVTTFFGLAGTGGILGTVATAFVTLGDKVLLSMGIMTGSVTIAGLVGFGAVLGVVALAGWGIYEAMQPAFESVDLFGKGVSDVTEGKLKPFIDTFNSLDTELKTLDWSNKVITTEDVDSIMTKVNSMVEGILNEVDADRNEELKDLEMLKGLEGVSAETYEAMITDTNEFYDTVVNRTQEGKDQIKAITEKAVAEQRDLSTAEREEINRINEGMRSDAITTMTESEEEQMLILGRLKFNTVALSLEQAEEILTNAKENHKNQLVELEDWKTRSSLALEKKYKEEGIMSEAEYLKAQTAIETSYNERKGIVDQTLTDITEGTKTELGEQSKWVDWETGEQKEKWELWAVAVKEEYRKVGVWFDEKVVQPIKEKWDTFWSFDWVGPLFEGIWNGIKSIGSWVGKKFDEWVVQPMVSVWNGIIDILNWGIGAAEKGINWVINQANKIGFDIPDWLGGGHFGIDIDNVKFGRLEKLARGGFVPQRAGFVSPDSWTAGEAGKELIGSYKGRTTVMPLENTSFVSTMYEAVYDAVRDASQQNEITVVVQPKVKLDSREIAQGQEEYKFKSGGSLIKKR